MVLVNRRRAFCKHNKSWRAEGIKDRIVFLLHKKGDIVVFD